MQNYTSYNNNCYCNRSNSCLSTKTGNKNPVVCTYILLQQLDDLLYTLIHCLCTSGDVQLGVNWLLVLLVDTSEALDKTSSGLLVQTLHIALLTHVQGRGHVTLEELESRLLVDLASTLSVL